jgi:hypothetical protein
MPVFIVEIDEDISIDEIEKALERILPDGRGIYAGTIKVIQLK